MEATAAHEGLSSPDGAAFVSGRGLLIDGGYSIVRSMAAPWKIGRSRAKGINRESSDSPDNQRSKPVKRS